MNITWYLSDLHACGHVRGEVIAREIGRQFRNIDIVCKSDVLISDFYRSNIMVWQRQDQPGIIEKMRLAKRMGIKNIYELDDDVFNIPPEFQKPYVYYARDDVRERIKIFLGEADAITVSTPTMASAIQSYSPGIPKFVVENALDVDQWEGAYTHRMANLLEKNTVTVGWMASGSHQIDVPLVAPALFQLMQEYPELRLHLIGWIGWEQLGEQMVEYKDRIVTEPWINSAFLPDAMRDIDIGLCPLVDNAFNRAKSNVKWQQYSALGCTTVASKSPAYANLSNGVNALVVEDNSPGGWYAAIKSLLVDGQHCHAIGMNARSELLGKWDMRKCVSNWAWVFDKVAGM